MDKTIIIKKAKIVFADLEDKGFGKSITIAVDDAAKKAIEAWVKENGINGGVAKFKSYTNEKTNETTLQYTFKFSKFTQIASEVPEADGYGLGYGAVVNLQAKAYDYDNKFGKGTSASLAGLFVVEPKVNTMMENLKK